MCDTQFNLLFVPVANFQSFRSRDSTAHKLRCTDDQSFHNAEPRNDFVWFWVEEPPKGDVGDLRPAQLVRIVWLQHGLRRRYVVILRELQLENQGIRLPSNGLLRVCDKVFRRKQADLVVVNIKCLWVATRHIRIPGTRYYYVNNTINLVVFNHFWPKPPQAEGDMQTDDDAARAEEYRWNRIASVGENEEDEVEKEKEDEEDDEE